MAIFNWNRRRGPVPCASRTPDDDPTDLSWSTLRHYEQAAAELTKGPGVCLPRDSFTRLSAMDVSDLPMPKTITVSGGCKLAFRHYAGCSDEATAVVLIHGSAGHGAQLHALARGIAASGNAQVYTLDMRGHGLSGGSPGHAVPHPDRLCEDIAEFIAFLDRTDPRPRIVLGGHSAGGGLALRFGRSHAGRRVSGYFFLTPYLGLGSSTIRPFFGGWIRLRMIRVRALMLANVLGITQFNNATVVSFDLAGCPDSKLYTPNWSFNTVLAMGPGRWTPGAKGIGRDKTVLVVTAERDECFYADAYPEAFSLVAPHAEVRTIRSVGHWDVLVEPELVRIVADWLSRTTIPQNRESSPARAVQGT